MIYSYRWLQEHIDEQLPSPEELVATIMVKSFEVESVTPRGDGDTIFDIKVLPNRVHDALSHIGMAREIAVLFGLSMKDRKVNDIAVSPSSPSVTVKINDASRCARYIGVRVNKISITASPVWLATKLSAIGQRPVNNVVDLTNFILFDLGQPMHVFDADKVSGAIVVRVATSGERMSTLDGKDIELCGTETVIADENGILALAGVRGGKRAEVSNHTSSVIFECANFNPVFTRAASVLHGIRTDASKRFEGGISSELTGHSMRSALLLLDQVARGSSIGIITDEYPRKEDKAPAVVVSEKRINRLLGTAMSNNDIELILLRMRNVGFVYSAKNSSSNEDAVYTITAPHERLDLRNETDFIEEFGRLYGYGQIMPSMPKLAKKGFPNKRLYYANKVRNFLVERGFSEVYTYSFAGKTDGEVEVENPIGKDRPFMRKSLASGIRRALALNMNIHTFLESEDVKIFEIGTIFRSACEELHLAIGYLPGNKKKAKVAAEDLRTVLGALEHSLCVNGDGAWVEDNEMQCFSREINFGELIKDLNEPTQNAFLAASGKSVVYHTPSVYPFIIRDVALWVPKETKADDVEIVVRANAGDLAQKIYLFDTFEKPNDHEHAEGDGKKSFAFRIVLQSYERTLEDAEANAVCEKIVFALEKTNPLWEVRK